MSPDEARAILALHNYTGQGTRQIDEPARSEIKAALLVLDRAALPPAPPPPEPDAPPTHSAAFEAERAANIAADAERTAAFRQSPPPLAERPVTVRVNVGGSS